MKHKKLISFFYYGIIFLIPSALSVSIFLYSDSFALAVLMAFPGIDMAMVRAAFMADTLNKEKPYHRIFDKFIDIIKILLPIAEVLILLLSPMLGGWVYCYGTVFGAIFAPFFTEISSAVISKLGFGKKKKAKIKESFFLSFKTLLRLPLNAVKSSGRCINLILTGKLT